MPTITFSTVVTVPFLALISIPLILTAFITVCFSILALCIRLSTIYIELSYALIANYFVIPTSTNSSLLTFAASEPTTPAVSRRQSADHSLNKSLNLHRSASARQLRVVLPSNGAVSHPSLRRYNSSDYSRSRECRSTPRSPSTPFLSLVSGDEGRDFEGLGGWRCLGSTFSKPRSGLPSRAASSSSSSPPSDPSVHNEEADERAWLSINHRLELPSMAPEQQQQQAPPQPRGRRRHHQRSITTSLVTSNFGNGNSLSIDRNTIERLRLSPGSKKRDLGKMD